MNEPALYLIPTVIADTDIDRVIPAANLEVMRTVKFFIVENVRTARRYLKKADKAIDIDALTFFELNKHTSREEIMTYLKPLEEGNPMGIISEAGCPAIADPGADVVALAQRAGMRVVPLVGPSSILLSLMASGFNGQSFAFNGYLPVDKDERAKAIKRFERKVYEEDQTQIFIETPYRNNKIVSDFTRHCRPSTRLCIAANITCDDEFIRTRTVSQWKSKPVELPKVPCIFLIYR